MVDTIGGDGNSNGAFNGLTCDGVGSVGVGSTVVNAVDKVLNLEFCFVGSDSSTPVELPAFSLTIFDIDHEGVEGD